MLSKTESLGSVSAYCYLTPESHTRSMPIITQPQSLRVDAFSAYCFNQSLCLISNLENSLSFLLLAFPLCRRRRRSWLEVVTVS